MLAVIRLLDQLAGTPAETGVEMIQRIDHGGQYSIPAPDLAYGGALDQSHRVWADAFLSPADGLAPPISLFRLSECLITPNAAVMTLTGNVVQESLYPYVRIDDVVNAFRPFVSTPGDGRDDVVYMQVRGATKLTKPIYFGREHGEAGYFHWLHSILPRARVYKNHAGPRHMLNVAMTARFQRESMDVLGWPQSDMFFSDGNTLFCKEVFFCSPMVIPDLKRSGGFFERSLLANAMLRELAAGLTPGDGPRRILISRADASIRRLVDEDVIVDGLSGLGIERVILSGMSFVEQMRLFASAELVVGMHGAGLSNIAFMAEGAAVIEILTPDRLWPTYRGVAARSNLRYSPYVGDATGERAASDSDVKVDTAHFVEFVGAALGQSRR